MSPENPAAKAPTATAADKSFPLRARFRRWIVLGLIVFSILLVVAVAIGTRSAIQEVYLDLAQRRAAALGAAINESAPTEWHLLLSAPSVTDFYATAQGRKLAQTVKEETRELKAGRIKIYAASGLVLFDAMPSRIGRIVEARIVTEVYDDKEPILVEGTDDYGAAAYRMFVPLVGRHGAVEAVVEIDEPTGYLDRVIWQNLLTPAAAPALLLIALIGALCILVNRAQLHIDARTQTLVAIRRQLEAFVSRGTVAAAGQAADSGAAMARRSQCTLLYADVRGFSSFAELVEPETVVGFLGRVTDCITSSVREHGGDIDKLLGDGALARFDGTERKARAVAAAQVILRRLAGLNLPRGIGIGLYDGAVIATVIGSNERKDFTVIGDAVNIAARLCDIAGEGQIVAEASLLDDLPQAARGFGAVEEVTVKGRRSRVRVRRWTLG